MASFKYSALVILLETNLLLDTRGKAVAAVDQNVMQHVFKQFFQYLMEYSRKEDGKCEHRRVFIH